MRFIKPFIRVLRNKYILTSILFVVWVGLFDANNLIERFKEMKALKQLKDDKTYYEEKIREDRRKLNELETDKQSLEKYAREQYMIKRPDEDLFIVLEK
jgi:cell division protein DivIC